MKAENARPRQSRTDLTGLTAGDSDGGAAKPTETPKGDDGRPAVVHAGVNRRPRTPDLLRTSDDRTAELSARAENVLKELAVELTDDKPARGQWIPSDQLLQRLTYQHLTTARNCGPQTTAEIVRWAQTRGKIIEPSVRVGRSLSAMWQDVIARFSSGEASRAELAAALENSARRRNTRIPVEFQRVLLQVVNSPNK